MSTAGMTQLFADIEADRSVAQCEVFDAYYQRLVDLVRKNVKGRLSRRFDASDVAMSAFRSFFHHARSGDFACENRSQLWRLLATIATNKLRNRVRFHQAGRRNIAEEAHVDELISADDRPNVEELAVINEEIEQVISKLKPYHREIAERILAGQPHARIAAETKRSTRTVRRVGNQLEKALVLKLSQSSEIS